MLHLENFFEKSFALLLTTPKKSMKQVIFVGINILLWAAIAFIVCVAGSVIGGSFNEKWRFMTFLITGYSAVIMGFFRSVFYLLRK